MSNQFGPILILILSLVLLWVGAEGLVRGGASLARRLGLTPLVIGLTVVAFGTSSPELVVSAQAALAGQGDIALGNVVGSNILNICFILGLSALIFPLKISVKLLRLDVPIMMGISVLLVFLMLDGRMARVEAGLLFVLVIVYTVFNVRLARRETAALADPFVDAAPISVGRPLWLELVLIVGGLAILVVGSRLLVSSSVTLARAAGVGEAVIGLTIVAAGTSMPELATSVVAAVRRQADISVGNIIGSNIFNILGILGFSGLLQPLQTLQVSLSDYVVMLVAAVAILPLMRTGFILRRWEGAVLLAFYGGYVTFLILR